MTNNADITKNEKTTVKFEWGAPEPLTESNRLDLLNVFFDPNAKHYTPPILPSGLDTLTRANATHRRCINFKVNQMAICFKPSKAIPLLDFKRAARDLETFGDYYFENIFIRSGHHSKLKHLPALNMRKGKKGGFTMLKPKNKSLEWDSQEITNGFHYDTGQSIYGVPDWIGCMQDVLLNSEATRFRRRYYLNGSHMGYILYTNLPDLDGDVEEQIQDAVTSGKGIGNFKSVYINSPGGHEKAVQIIPVGDIAQKDEFQKVKNLSADDIIVAHGVPPQLAGMKPDNVGGFGDIEKLAKWYRASEVQALVQPFIELNDKLPNKMKFQFDFNQ
jgi:PBSX family phage portal protein